MGIRRPALIAAVLVMAGAAGAGASPRATPRPGVRHAPGWLVVSAGPDNPSVVVAVTSADAAAVHPVALFGSFRKLSASGVLIWAESAGRGRKGFPSAATWPPRL